MLAVAAKNLTIVFDEKKVPSVVSNNGRVLKGEILVRSVVV